MNTPIYVGVDEGRVRVVNLRQRILIVHSSPLKQVVLVCHVTLFSTTLIMTHEWPEPCGSRSRYPLPAEQYSVQELDRPADAVDKAL